MSGPDPAEEIRAGDLVQPAAGASLGFRVGAITALFERDGALWADVRCEAGAVEVLADKLEGYDYGRGRAPRVLKLRTAKGGK